MLFPAKLLDRTEKIKPDPAQTTNTEIYKPSANTQHMKTRL